MKTKQKQYECGFDLTEIPATKFFKLLALNKLKWTNRKKENGAYVWGFDEGYIVTCNDPLTGNYYNNARDPEIGYASYIGVTGSKSFRDRVAKFIKRNANYKDYDPKQRSFV